MKVWGRGFTLRWLGHSAFHLTTPSGKHVLLDPWLTGNPMAPPDAEPARVDLILASHGHSDHIGDVVRLAKKHACPVVCGFELSLYFESQGVTTASGMGKGGTQVAAGIAVTATHAIHSSSVDHEASRPYAGEAMGFVLKLENGDAIYFAGDTGPMMDMQLIGDLYEPLIAILPIGDFYTMGPREAAYAARLLRAPFVVGMHYGTFPPLVGRPEMLEAELAKLSVTARVVRLEPGGSAS
jgi:L-ascorbate metabolism protein UlaG (beta-lactamase superfamily)